MANFLFGNVFWKIQLGSDRTKLHLAKIWCIIIQSDENLKFNCLSISNSPSKFSKLTVRFIELKNTKKHIWQKFVATCSFIRLVWEYKNFLVSFCLSFLLPFYALFVILLCLKCFVVGFGFASPSFHSLTKMSMFSCFFSRLVLLFAAC